jgi:hypothetical protein
VDKPVELVPLLCLRCSAPIPAQPEEVAWVCVQCGQGNLLDETKGLAPLDIHYSASLAPQAIGKPFWTAHGRVVLERDTFKGRKLKEAEKFWEDPRRFCIPAYQCSMDFLISQGKKMLFQTVEILEGNPAPFDPVVLSLKDVQSAAELMVIAIEAERKDMLRRLQFSVELDAPVLWVLP